MLTLNQDDIEEFIEEILKGEIVKVSDKEESSNESAEMESETQ